MVSATATPTPRLTDRQERALWMRIALPTDPDECWGWLGARTAGGYGVAWDGSQATSAHRVVYELLVGPVPDELEVDHDCLNRGCVNPGHLFVVTPQANQLRSDSVSGLNARKVTCPRGHAYSGHDSTGRRICHPCQAERQRQYRERRAA